MRTGVVAGDRTRHEDTACALAHRHAERVRNLEAHVVAFVVGAIILTALWVLTEYLEADGWPQRFGDEDAPGTWHLWLFYVLGVWALVVALKAVGTYFDRPSRHAATAGHVRADGPTT